MIASSTGVRGYLLAVAIALSGTVGARMQDSGEMARAYHDRPLAVLLVSIPYAVSGLAALLYFSWAYLGWLEIATFFVGLLALTYWDTSDRAPSTSWSLFVGSVLLASVAELAGAGWPHREGRRGPTSVRSPIPRRCGTHVPRWAASG